MRRDRWDQLGWVMVAAIAGVLLAGAFQGATDKQGVVDISKVVEDSDIGKANQETFKQMKAAREGVLEFLDSYRLLTNEQAQRLRDLSLKATRTADETAELDRIKAEVIASSKKYAELGGKPSLTPDERTLMDDYTKRGQVMEQVGQRWFREFTAEMQGWADKQKASSLDLARKSVQEVAKAQGFSIVFEAGIAPYGSNDLTASALQAMNAKK
ncbi:MAG: hypothetical protein HYR64_06445 [Fimbriimonas ginsengisoli]|uniref:OmpH family outer membrane protein n=1 Tax=Fimbriimonas ginsengisoli TaxID=1005039 RepID=A0A931LV27_FIMGI|nr:hypothetical protein [Fimbriimonas ginsengisoli]